MFNKLTAALSGAGVVAIALTAAPASASTHPAVVRSFNDGFTSAKQDDCQQGFAAACAWLRHSTHPARELLPWWLAVQWPASDPGCVYIYNRTPAGDTGVRMCRNGVVEPS